MKYHSLFAACAFIWMPNVNATDTETLLNWQAIEEQARGQTVYFNAWGGSQDINNYLRWVAKELSELYDIDFKHVKVTDTTESVSRLLAEKIAKKNTNGSIDMMWINGENFKSLKSHKLLFGPFAERLPNWNIVDTSLPVMEDFTEPTEGLEAPWGVGQLVFVHDKEVIPEPPRSFEEILILAKEHKGKISYPKPPQFHGSAFLKAAMLELVEDKEVLYKEVDPTNFDKITAKLWQYLDQLHSVAWRGGKQFPNNSADTLKLLDDGELLLGITFNPNEAQAAINHGLLAESAQAFALESGALTNIHFLAIPWNAKAKEGALVAINFLMSEEAQYRKANNEIWGDPMVVKIAKSTSNKLFKSQPEPHPSWQVELEKAWLARYSN